jgi:hypothetical protein
MKKKFKTGEWCKFSNEEIPHILDVLAANEYGINFRHSSNTNDCILMDASGQLTPFNQSLMTDKFLEYSETDRHTFMVIALRLEEGMGIHWEQISIGQRQHIAVEMENLGIKQTVPTQERGETRYGGSFMLSSGEWKMTTASVKHQIPYTELCKRLCVEPIGSAPRNREPNSFCVTPDEKCTSSYCDDNGCINRKRSLTDPIYPAPAEPVFDSSKPFEVSHPGLEWVQKPEYHYVGVNRYGNHTIQDTAGMFEAWRSIRNTEAFTAAMLKVGEWMETEAGKDGHVNLILKIRDNDYIDLRNHGGIFHDDIAEMCIGRRVDVEIKVKEV